MTYVKTVTIMGFPIEVHTPTPQPNKFATFTDEALCKYMLDNKSASMAHVEFNNRGYHVLTCQGLALVYAELLLNTGDHYAEHIKRTTRRLNRLGDRLAHPRFIRNAERQYWALHPHAK